MDQDETWHARHSSPPPKGGGAPNFRRISVVAKPLDGSRCPLPGRYRPQPKGHCVRWGSSSPSPKRWRSPQFSAHVYCGHRTPWIKMPPDMQVSLGPGHIVLDGDPAPPPQKGAERPQFSAHICCGQMAGRIKMPLGREVGPTKRHCVRYGPRSPLPPKGPSLPTPIFGPRSDSFTPAVPVTVTVTVAKRLDG